MIAELSPAERSVVINQLTSVYADLAEKDGLRVPYRMDVFSAEVLSAENPE